MSAMVDACALSQLPEGVSNLSSNLTHENAMKKPQQWLCQPRTSQAAPAGAGNNEVKKTMLGEHCALWPVSHLTKP